MHEPPSVPQDSTYSVEGKILMLLCIADYSPALNVSHGDDDLKDPFCDPDHPVVIRFQDVSAAAFRIQGGIDRTPCTVCDFLKTYNVMYCWYFV